MFSRRQLRVAVSTALIVAMCLGEQRGGDLFSQVYNILEKPENHAGAGHKQGESHVHDIGPATHAQRRASHQQLARHHVLVQTAATSAGTGRRGFKRRSLSDAIHYTKGSIINRLRHLEEIAKANDGNRAAGTSGYNASAQYVIDALGKLSGWNVTQQNFNFSATQSVQGSLVLSSKKMELIQGTDFKVAPGSPSAKVSGLVRQVTGIGCNTSDFPNHTGSVVLVARGNCTLKTKVEYARAAGATAMIIYNKVESREIEVELSGSFFAIPVFEVSHLIGKSLASTPEKVHLGVDHTSPRILHTSNIIAEVPGGNQSNKIVIGAHLDSVAAGPGINENGSGSMVILQIAELIAKYQNTFPKDRPAIQFCWWGAEVEGSVGSRHYLNSLPHAQIAEIAMYLNIDTLASPNWVRRVFTASNVSQNSELWGEVPTKYLHKVRAVATRIGAAFAKHFKERKLQYEMKDVFESLASTDGASFLSYGIPAGGFDTGSKSKKSMQERTQYGGMANASYDPCYHRKCDTIENVAQVVLMQNAKVIGAVIDDLINTRIQLRQVFGTSLEEQNDMSLQLLEHDLLHTMQESR